MPLVTLITVVRNDSEGLRRTLDSVAAQTFRDFQFVMVDGVSTDGTIDLIRQAPRVDTWISEPLPSRQLEWVWTSSIPTGFTARTARLSKLISTT
ncbi:MAG: hypothetical protein B7X81_07080 [Hydrogenophilales bacterium 17-61-76]|nr:MAG: hypothetical protein B7X81_07080 [Hydrogenophilales bacterium 17-61-76]